MACSILRSFVEAEVDRFGILYLLPITTFYSFAYVPATVSMVLVALTVSMFAS